MTRRYRTKNYIKLINSQWTDYYWNFILNNLDKDLSWEGLSLNPNITMSIIDEYNYLPWVWEKVSCNPNITIDFLLKYINKDWDWFSLSENMNLDIIENNLNLPWDWDGISNNKDINIEFILKYKDQDFCWRTLSSHSNITIDNIIDTKYTLPWKWKYIMLNPNITLDFINKYKNKINWSVLSSNNYLSMDIIDNDLPWDYYILSNNPNLTNEFINKHIDKKNIQFNWDVIYQKINSTKNLTENIYFDFDNLNNINWKYLSGNNLYKNKQLFIERKLLEYMATYRIQQWYIKISVDIQYKFARNKIFNDYDKIYLIKQ